MDLRLAWAVLASACCLHAASARVCTGNYDWMTHRHTSLRGCTAIDGDCSLTAVTDLTSWNITEVTGTLKINDNVVAVTNFGNFDLTQVTKVGSIDMYNNNGLTVAFAKFAQHTVPAVTMTGIVGGSYDLRAFNRLASVSITNTQNTEVNMEDVQAVDGAIDIRNTIETTVILKDVVSVSGAVDILENFDSTVNIPNIEFCGGDFTFWGNNKFEGFEFGSQEKYFGGKLVLHNNAVPNQGNLWGPDQHLVFDNFRVFKYISVQYQQGITQQVSMDVTLDRVSTKYLHFKQNTQMNSFSLSNSLFEGRPGVSHAGIYFMYNSNPLGSLTVDIDEIEIFSLNAQSSTSAFNSRISLKYNQNVQSASLANVNVWNPRGDKSTDQQISRQELFVSHNVFVDRATSSLDVTNLNFRNGDIDLSYNSNLGLNLHRVETSNLKIKYNGNMNDLTIDYLMGNKYKSSTSYDKFHHGSVDVSYNGGSVTNNLIETFDIEWTNSYLRGTTHFTFEHNRAVGDVTFTDVALLNHQQGKISHFSNNHVAGEFEMNRVEVPEKFELNLNNPLNILTLKYSRMENIHILHNRYMIAMNVNDVFVNNMFVKYSNSRTGLDVTMQDLWSNSISNSEYGSPKLSGKYLIFEHNDNLKYVKFANVDAFSYTGPGANVGAVSIRHNTEWHDVSTQMGEWFLEIDNTHLYSSLSITHNLELTSITITDSVFEVVDGVTAGIKYNENMKLIHIADTNFGGTLSYAAAKTPVVTTAPQLEIAYQNRGNNQVSIALDNVLFSGLAIDQSSLSIHNNHLDFISIDGLHAYHLDMHHNVRFGAVLSVSDSMINFLEAKYNQMTTFTIADSYINDIAMTHNTNTKSIKVTSSISNSLSVKYQLNSTPSLDVVFDDLWVGQDPMSAAELSRVQDQKYLRSEKYNLVFAYNQKVNSIALKNSHVYVSTFIKYNGSDLGAGLTLDGNRNANQIVVQGNSLKYMTLTHSFIHSAVVFKANHKLASVDVKYVTQLNTKYDQTDSAFLLKNNVGTTPWKATVTHSFLKIGRSHEGAAGQSAKYMGRLSVNGNKKLGEMTIDNSMILGLPIGFQYNTQADTVLKITNSRLAQASKYGCGSGIAEMCFHTFRENHLQHFEIHNVDSAAPFNVKYNVRSTLQANQLWDFSMDSSFVEFKAVNKEKALATKLGAWTWEGPSSLYMKYNNLMGGISITHSLFSGDLLVRGTNQAAVQGSKAATSGATFTLKYLSANTVGLKYNLLKATSVMNTEVSGKSSTIAQSKIGIMNNHMVSLALSGISGTTKITNNVVDHSIQVNGLSGTGLIDFAYTNKEFQVPSVLVNHNYQHADHLDFLVSLTNLNQLGNVEVKYNQGQIRPAPPASTPAPLTSFNINVEQVNAGRVNIDFNGQKSTSRAFTHVGVTLKNADLTGGKKNTLSHIGAVGTGALGSGTKTATIAVSDVRSQTGLQLFDLHSEKTTLDISKTSSSRDIEIGGITSRGGTKGWVSITDTNAESVNLVQSFMDGTAVSSDSKYIVATHLTGVHTKKLQIKGNKYLDVVKIGAGTRFLELDLGVANQQIKMAGVQKFTHIDMISAEHTMLARVAYAAKYFETVNANGGASNAFFSDVKYAGVPSAIKQSTVALANFKYFLEPVAFHPLRCLNHQGSLAPRDKPQCEAVSGCKYIEEMLPGMKYTKPSDKYRCVHVTPSRPSMCPASLKSTTVPPTTTDPTIHALTQCDVKFGGMKIWNARQSLPMKAQFIFGKTDIQKTDAAAGSISFNNIFSFKYDAIRGTDKNGQALRITGNKVSALSIGPSAAGTRAFVSGKISMKDASGTSDGLGPSPTLGNTVSTAITLQRMTFDTGDLIVEGQDGMNAMEVKYVAGPFGKATHFKILQNTNVGHIKVHELAAPYLSIKGNTFNSAKPLMEIDVRNIRGQNVYDSAGTPNKYFTGAGLKIDGNLGPLKSINIHNAVHTSHKYIMNNQIHDITVDSVYGTAGELLHIKNNQQLKTLSVSNVAMAGLFVDTNTGVSSGQFSLDMTGLELSSFLYLTNNVNLGNTAIKSVQLADQNLLNTHKSFKMDNNVGDFTFVLEDVSVSFPQKYVASFTDPASAGTQTASGFPNYGFALNDFEITNNNGFRSALFKDISVTGVEWSKDFGHSGRTGLQFTSNAGAQHFSFPGFPLSFEDVTWHGQKYRTQFQVKSNTRLSSINFQNFDLATKYFEVDSNKNNAAQTFTIEISHAKLSSRVALSSNDSAQHIKILDTNVDLISGDDETLRNQLLITNNQGGISSNFDIILDNLKVLGSRTGQTTGVGTDFFTPNTQKYAAIVVSHNDNVRKITMTHILTDDVTFIGKNTDQFDLDFKYVTGSRYVSIMENNLKTLTVSHFLAQFDLDQGRSLGGFETAVDGLYISRNTGPVNIDLHNLNLVGFNELTASADNCVAAAATPEANKSKLCPSQLTLISNSATSLSIDAVEMRGSAYLTHNLGTGTNMLKFTNVEILEAKGAIFKYNEFTNIELTHIKTNKDMRGDAPVGSANWFDKPSRGEGFQVIANKGLTLKLEHVTGANPIVVRHNHVTQNIVLNEISLGDNAIMRPNSYLRVFWNNHGKVAAPISITNVDAEDGFVSVGDNNVVSLAVDTILASRLYINDNTLNGALSLQNVVSPSTRKGLLWQKYLIDQFTTGTKTKYATVSVTRNINPSAVTIKNIDISELYKHTPNPESMKSAALLIKYNTRTSGFDLDVEKVRVEMATKYKAVKYHSGANVQVDFNRGAKNIHFTHIDLIVPRSVGTLTNHLLDYGPKVQIKGNDVGALPLSVTASYIHGLGNLEVVSNKGTGPTSCGSFTFDHIVTDQLVLKDNICTFSTLKWSGATFSYMNLDKLTSVGNVGLDLVTLAAPVDLGDFQFDTLSTAARVDLSGLVFDASEYPGFRGNTCERIQDAWHFDPAQSLWNGMKKAPWHKYASAFDGGTNEKEIPMDCPGIDIDRSVGAYPPIQSTFKYAFASKYSVFGATVRNFRGESMQVTDPIDGQQIKIPTSEVSYEWALRVYGVIQDADMIAGDKILNRASNREALKITVNSQGEYTWGPDTENLYNWGSQYQRPWLMSVQMLEQTEDGRLYSYTAEQVVLVDGSPVCAPVPHFLGGTATPPNNLYPTATAPTFTDNFAGAQTLDPTTTASTFQGHCHGMQPVRLYSFNEGAKNTIPLRYYFWIAAGVHMSTLVGTYDPASTIKGSFHTADLIFIGEDGATKTSQQGYAIGNGNGYAIPTLPAGTWTVGVDVQDEQTGAMVREVCAQSVTIKPRSVDVTMELLDSWLSLNDQTTGTYYKDQSMVVAFGAALLDYHVNATVGAEMIKKLVDRVAVVKANVYASVPATRAAAPLSRLGQAAMISGAIVAEKYLSTIDAAWLTANIDNPIRALLQLRQKGRAHSLAFYGDVLTIYSRLARRGSTILPENHPLYVNHPEDPGLRSAQGRRLMTHLDFEDMTDADVLYLGSVVQGIENAMGVIGLEFSAHESGELFRHTVNDFDFAVDGFDLKEGHKVSFSGGLNVPAGTADTMYEIMPVGEFEHWYRVEMWSTPLVMLPGHRLVTGIASARIRTETGAVPTATVSEMIHDAGVYVYVPITPGAEVCAEYQCLSYKSTVTVDVWDKTGLFGTAVKEGDHIKCRLTGDALVVGACTPRGSVVGDPYVFAPQTDTWEPFHPSNDQLYSLVEGKDFHVQGGFAAATKASCQCVWVDEDETQAPRAGNRLAAVIFEFNGGVFHITPTGLFYEQAGEWMEVPKAEWSPAQVASGDALVTTDAAGELTVNDMRVEWGAVAQQESFPWGEHDYTYQFKANIPRAGLLTVLAGVDAGINVMDVHFEPKAEAQASVGGLIGVALASGKTGIESFAAKALP